MSDNQITLECALDAVQGALVCGRGNHRTWYCRAPLRFVIRDGNKILQQAWSCIETGEIDWRDVPLENQ